MAMKEYTTLSKAPEQELLDKKQFSVQPRIERGTIPPRRAQSVGAWEYNVCLEYDTEQSDGKVAVLLELWGMRRTPSLPSLLDPL